MSPIILITGAGRSRLVDAAKTLNLAVCERGKADDPDALVALARSEGVCGIVAADSTSLEPVSQAARALNLPGLPPDVAERFVDKQALRQTLCEAGVAVPPYSVAATEIELESAAREFGLPATVTAVDGPPGGVVTHVDYIEDLSLAIEKAVRLSPTGVVLVERAVEGPLYVVAGACEAGAFRSSGVVYHDLALAPYRCVNGMVAPPVEYTADLGGLLRETAAEALAALGVERGVAEVEIALTTEGPRVRDVNPLPTGSYTSFDLLREARGLDLWGDAIRVAMGESPIETEPGDRAAAVYWIPSHSGVVTEIRGADEARAIPGVEEVCVAVQPGDQLGHVIDMASRDRIGYVRSTADTPDAAVHACRTALETLEILTDPVLRQG